MADVKTTNLTELAEVPAQDDLIMGVDVSDETMAASGTNKGIQFSNLLAVPFKASVYSNAAQNSNTDSVWKKKTFDTEIFDTNDNFTGSTFTAPVDGYYQINAAVEVSSATNKIMQAQIAIYKEGVDVRRGSYSWVPSGVAGARSTISELLYLEATDTVDIYAYASTSDASDWDMSGGYQKNYFSIHLLSTA